MTLKSSFQLNMTTPKFINSVNKELGVPVSNVKPLVKLLVSDGVALTDLLQGTDIQLSDFLDVNKHINFNQHIRLIHNARLFSKDPTYALKLGEQFFINHDGILACRVMSSENTQEAMELLSKYQALLTGLLDLDFSIEDDYGVLSVTERFPLADTMWHFVEYSFAAIFSIGKFCLGDKNLHVIFEFERKDHGHTKEFETFLGNPVRFNCDKNRVLIPKESLKRPIVFADKESALQAEKLCELHLKQLANDTEVIHKVKNTMRGMPFNQVSLESLADRMHMSPRTLRRHLHSQGVSFKTLLENERKSIAVKRIEKQDISLEKLAELLGYNSASSLSRAFKRWYGVSPNNYKKGQ
jgi:AraC-like DNA-binding protein